MNLQLEGKRAPVTGTNSGTGAAIAKAGRLLAADEEDGKIIGVVCHGQAALLSANGSDGDWQFAGRRLTAFSDEEEVEFGTADNAPWLLASALR